MDAEDKCTLYLFLTYKGIRHVLEPKISKLENLLCSEDLFGLNKNSIALLFICNGVSYQESQRFKIKPTCILVKKSLWKKHSYFLCSSRELKISKNRKRVEKQKTWREIKIPICIKFSFEAAS